MDGYVYIKERERMTRFIETEFKNFVLALIHFHIVLLSSHMQKGLTPSGY